MEKSLSNLIINFQVSLFLFFLSYKWKLFSFLFVFTFFVVVGRFILYLPDVCTVAGTKSWDTGMFRQRNKSYIESKRTTNGEK